LNHKFLNHERERILRDDILPAFQIRKRIGAMHLGVVWHDIIRGEFSVSEIEQNLLTAATQYFDERCARVDVNNMRFIDYKPAFPADVGETPTPPNEATRKEFKAWLKDFVADFVKATLPQMLESAENLPPGQGADGLVIQVATLAGAMDRDADDV